MAIVLVQNSAAISTSDTNTLPVASTAGNLLVACMQGAASYTPPSGWTLAGTVEANSGAAIYYYTNNPGSLSSFTFTSALQLLILEFSGVATSSPLDTSGNNGAGTSPVTATTSGNVSAANELAVAIGADAETKAGTTTLGEPATWTAVKNNGASSLTGHTAVNYLLNPTSGGTLSAQYSSSSMNLSVLGVMIAVFKLFTASPIAGFQGNAFQGDAFQIGKPFTVGRVPRSGTISDPFII